MNIQVIQFDRGLESRQHVVHNKLNYLANSHRIYSISITLTFDEVCAALPVFRTIRISDTGSGSSV
jgi:hypothetical protein